MAENGTSRSKVGPTPSQRERRPLVETASRIDFSMKEYDRDSDCRKAKHDCTFSDPELTPPIELKPKA